MSSTFEQHYRDYQDRRSGAKLYRTEFGFVVYSMYDTDHGRVINIEEFYSERGTPFHRTLGMINHIAKLGKKAGCKFLVGANSVNLPTYEDIKTVHTFYKMHFHSSDGSSELWIKQL